MTKQGLCEHTIDHFKLFMGNMRRILCTAIFKGWITYICMYVSYYVRMYVCMLQTYMYS